MEIGGGVVGKGYSEIKIYKWGNIIKGQLVHDSWIGNIVKTQDNTWRSVQVSSNHPRDSMVHKILIVLNQHLK